MVTKVKLYGLDKLRQWLKDQGFFIEKDRLHDQSNLCNWCAYRRSSLDARPCECNYDKPSMQIAIKPFVIAFHETEYESVQVELTGEAGGEWYKLMAYSMKPEELPEKLERVEQSLIAAWNALV